MHRFECLLSDEERQIIEGMTDPTRIQEFLDTLAYNTDDVCRCPLEVLRSRKAHCFDGAVFAAAMLRRIGFPPLLVNMFPNERDDEHLLAVFRRHDAWGAVAKSNFVGLRYREPIHRNLRELMISYFEPYYNVAGEKTLRSYTRPCNLARFDRLNWMVEAGVMDKISGRLDQKKRYPLLTPGMVEGLQPVDPVSYQAGLVAADPAGLFQLGE